MWDRVLPPRCMTTGSRPFAYVCRDMGTVWIVAAPILLVAIGGILLAFVMAIGAQGKKRRKIIADGHENRVRRGIIRRSGPDLRNGHKSPEEQL